MAVRSIDAPVVRATAHRRRRSRSLPFVYLFLALLAIFCVVPFLWILLASVDPNAGVHLQIPASIDLGSYTRFLTDPMFSRFVLNSLIMAGGSTILVIFTSALAGYGLSRFTSGAAGCSCSGSS